MLKIMTFACIRYLGVLAQMTWSLFILLINLPVCLHSHSVAAMSVLYRFQHTAS